MYVRISMHVGIVLANALSAIIVTLLILLSPFIH